MPLQLSPLKERREDVPLLVQLFLDQIARLHNLKSLAIGDDAIAVLQAQDWPGNARQLRNSIERLLILIKDSPPESGVITAQLLPSDIGEVLPTVGDTDESAHLMSLAAARGARSFRAPVSACADRALRREHQQDRGVRGHGAQRFAPQDQVFGALGPAGRQHQCDMPYWTRGRRTKA